MILKWLQWDIKHISCYYDNQTFTNERNFGTE